MSTSSNCNDFSTSTTKDDKMGQELFDIKTILNKVENGSTTEPDIPTKSSTEILSELFEAFNAEPPEILDNKEQITENGDISEQKSEDNSPVKNKKNKKSKKKHKHKDKKHKKKSKSSKKQGSSEDSDDGRKKHKHVSERKKKKHSDVQVKDNEVKITPAVESVSVVVTTDSDNNFKRTVECATDEQLPKKEIVETEESIPKPSEETKENTQIKEEKPPVAVSQTKPSTGM